MRVFNRLPVAKRLGITFTVALPSDPGPVAGAA